MALATAQAQHAWVAPVYYVYFRKAFYFFSDRQSRHIQEACTSGQAAATIYAQADRWQAIRGIQMSGRIQPVGVGVTAAQALAAYRNKFSFTQEFFEPGQVLDLDSFAKRFRVWFYYFEPAVLYYLDNEIKFGFREKVAL
jgi:uncharacterized protein YhbP (UPF0306 family)